MTKPPFFLNSYLAGVGMLALSIASPTLSADTSSASAHIARVGNSVPEGQPRSISTKSSTWYFLYMERGQTPISVGPFASVRQCNQIRQFAITRGSKGFSDASEQYVPRYTACWQA